jgi:geranyl-CoA carboxylase alpha subunit
LGVNSNKQFLVNLLRHPIIVKGDTNTAFIQEHFQTDASLHKQALGLEHLAVAAALLTNASSQSSWNTGIALSLPLKLKHDDQLLQLLVKRDQNQVSVEICGQTLGISIIEQQAEKFIYEVDGVRRSIDYVLDGNQLYLDAVNGNISIENITYAAPETSDVAGDGHIRAPMDGAIINILVNAGDTVTKGQTLLILEAMKIQQQIKSDVDGVVNEIIGQVGQQVKKRQLVLNIQA